MISAIFRHRNQICRSVRDLSCNLVPQVENASLPTHLSAIVAASSVTLLGQVQHSSFHSTSASTQPFRHLGSPKIWEQRRWAGAAAQILPPEEEVTLTENAIEKLHELCNGRADQCLRLTVEAGGCSGFSYKFDLDSEVNEGDRVFEAGGVRLVADSMSYEFIKGSRVDYSQELIKSSFEVIDNPNADKGCGCGTSFSPK